MQEKTPAERALLKTPERIARYCEYCNNEIPAHKRDGTRFCNKDHGDKYRLREKRISKALARSETEEHGPYNHKVYDRLTNEGYAEAIYQSEMSATNAAQILSVTVAAVSKAMGAYRVEREKQLKEADWSMSELAAFQLPKVYLDELRRLTLDQEESARFQTVLDRIVEAFWVFQHRHFTIGSRQAKFLVKGFHEEIIRELVISFVFAKRSLILTPPRHGKTEIIIRFIIWVLVMYPNLQLLWVGANTDLAGQALAKIKGVLQWTASLREDFLPPGRRFGDERAPKWNESEITLYTRTDRTLKSPSFTALGSTSTVAGRDADYIVVDDLEERKTVATAELREKSRLKHSEIMERQEDHTGVCTIASRQHIDDIPNHLEAEEDPDLAWRISTNTAHSDTCDLDPDIIEGHDTNGCVLMPEVRNYKWLMVQKAENESLGLPGRFELRYLQLPVPIEGLIFDIVLIRERCLNRGRGIGTAETEGGRLIGGLDPAPRGNQAAFLWMWTPTRIYMVDMEIQKGGGIAGALDVMERWHAKYQLDSWVYEDNAQQVEFFRNREFLELKAKLGLTVLSHTTGRNKHDPELGISSMAPAYHSGRIDLPYGTAEARRLVNILLRQLELWTSDGINKRGKSDVKMASWFPWPRMKRWTKEETKKVVVRQGDDMLGAVYPDDALSRMNKAPW